MLLKLTTLQCRPKHRHSCSSGLLHNKYVIYCNYHQLITRSSSIPRWLLPKVNCLLVSLLPTNHLHKSRAHFTKQWAEYTVDGDTCRQEEMWLAFYKADRDICKWQRCDSHFIFQRCVTDKRMFDYSQTYLQQRNKWSIRTSCLKRSSTTYVRTGYAGYNITAVS